MKASGTKTHSAASLACAVFLAMAVAALAWGTARGDDHVVAVCDEKRTGSVWVVEGHNRCSRSGAPEEIGDMGADGASSPADEGENSSEGEYAADGVQGATGSAGTIIPRKGPRGDDRAPGSQGENGHARAPPTSLSALRTGPGA
jgi:hypothetical protein